MKPLRSAIVTLKSRVEFQRVRGGGRAAMHGFVLEGKRRAPRGDCGFGGLDVDCPRFGFTITKKLGNAVVRNRMRRRLKSALFELARTHAVADVDYVVVARPPALDQDYASLKADLVEAFRRVGGGGNARSKSKRTSHGPSNSYAPSPDGGPKPGYGSTPADPVSNTANPRRRGS